MKSLFLAIALLALQTAPQHNGAGSWTFKTNHCNANKVLRHRESTTLWDTTQVLSPKLIIDFYRHTPVVSGTYMVVQGPPKAENEVSLGVGLKEDDVLVFYSTAGGREQVTVKASGDQIRIMGTAVDMAAQKDPKKHAPLSFDITLKP